jgi:alkylated DNA repair dioxygenase AlkB
VTLFPGVQDVLPHDGRAVLHESFLGPDESEAAFRWLSVNLPWESHDIVVYGRKQREPRLSTWHADDGLSYTYSGLRRTALPFAPVLDDLRQRCVAVTGSPFNSVLVNLYRDGSDGVGWHADDEPSNGREPVIASLSLGATRRFDLRHRRDSTRVSVDLAAGSLLVMSGLSQHCWVHQIAKTRRPVGPRINLTFRRVIAA